MFNPRDIIDLIAANVRKTRNPFGIPNSWINTWWRETPAFTRRPGDALLVTGLMYQSIPYIDAATRCLERLEDTPGAAYLRFGRLSRYIPGSLVGRGFSLLISKAAKKQFNGILQAICRLLTKSGVNFFYHPDMDFYSGILLYDLGDQEGFVEHARFVAKTLQLHGVQKVITVDPHTT
jgi:Fe-S oxidoreductase